MMSTVFNFINEHTILYFVLSVLILACFRRCLLRIPYATILSTLISTCGLIIGLAALFDSTTILERFTFDLLKRNYLFLNDLKIAYVFAALFIIIVIIFNLAIGFTAIDESIHRTVKLPSQQRSKSGCCEVSCPNGSTEVCYVAKLSFHIILCTIGFLPKRC